MICKLCANEADGIRPDKGDCGACGREFVVTINAILPRHKQRVMKISESGHQYISSVKCSGSHKPAIWGHAACLGCDCAHKRRGSLLASVYRKAPDA